MPIRIGQGRDLVVCTSQLKGANGLQVLGLQVELAVISSVIKRDQRRVNSDALQAASCLLDIVESNDGEISKESVLPLKLVGGHELTRAASINNQ